VIEEGRRKSGAYGFRRRSALGALRRKASGPEIGCGANLWGLKAKGGSHDFDPETADARCCRCYSHRRFSGTVGSGKTEENREGKISGAHRRLHVWSILRHGRHGRETLLWWGEMGRGDRAALRRFNLRPNVLIHPAQFNSLTTTSVGC
jgi:hypothetical protein